MWTPRGGHWGRQNAAPAGHHQAPLSCPADREGRPPEAAAGLRAAARRALHRPHAQLFCLLVSPVAPGTW